VSILLVSGIALLLLVLDVSLGGLLSLGPVRPSLTLPLIVYIGLQRGPIEGSVFGFALGLGQDIMGSLPLGATSFTYSVIGFACGKLWQGGSFRLMWPWGSFLLSACIFEEAIAHYLVSRGTGVEFMPLYFQSGLPSAVYTTALGLIWFLSPLHRVRSS
jgi:rod shape-determining protein MreD